MDKLTQLMKIEGYDDLTEMLAEASVDSVCWGICMNEGCDYTVEVEPDATENWCEACHTPSVRSCLSLAGVI